MVNYDWDEERKAFDAADLEQGNRVALGMALESDRAAYWSSEEDPEPFTSWVEERAGGLRL